MTAKAAGAAARLPKWQIRRNSFDTMHLGKIQKNIHERG
jgi:hypothetical protein